ncbi:MAG: DUF4097 family beta strand repeat-containing protein [Actinomycetota bacterium]|nr:DUF4097 family beta strand repeat-containing protein [Actinomycetota bacterium]
MINEVFQVGSDAEVDVHTHSGRVEVKTGSQDTISVEVETRDPGFIVEKRGDLIFVSSDKNTGWLSRGSAYVSIVVPESTDVSIATASARTECRGQLGRVEVKTASGNVEVEAAESLTIKTASAKADIGTVSGDVRVNTASGDITVEVSRGKAAFSSASGDIRVEESSGVFSASTASGNIRINRFSGSSASFKSMSGTATIGIPAGTKLDLDATILSGKLKLPKAAAGPPVDHQMSVRAKIVSGDLVIKRL